MNPTGLEPKVTLHTLLLTLGFALAITIADRLAPTLPTIAKVTGTFLISEETQAQVECEAHGINLSEIYWHRNGELLQTKECNDTSGENYCMDVHQFTDDKSKANLRLRLKSVTMVGEYRCIATDDYNVAISDVVKVQEKAFPESIPFPKQNQIKKVFQVTKGSSLIIKHNPINSLPEHDTTYFWKYKNGKAIWSKLNSGDLFINKVTEEDDDKVVQCLVKNRQFTQRKSSCGNFKIKIIEGEPETWCEKQEEQVNVEIGTSALDLTCACTGASNSVQWEHNGSILKHRESNLTMKNITMNSGGNYTCSTEDKLSMTYNVSVFPRLNSKIKLIAKSMEEVKFECKEQRVDTKWYIQGKPVATSRAKCGNFSCQQNKDGSVLSILNPPEALNIYCSLSNSLQHQWLHRSFNMEQDIDQTEIKSIDPVSTQMNTKPSQETTKKPTTPKLQVKKSTTLKSKYTNPLSTRTKPKPEVYKETTNEEITDPRKANLLTTLFPENNSLLGRSSQSTTKPEILNEVVTVPVKYILIGLSVLVVVLVIGAVVCTVLCMKTCQRRQQQLPHYPNTLSNLSYCSQLHRLKDFDGESTDSGIDARSRMLNPLQRHEQQDNNKNEFDEMIQVNGTKNNQSPIFNVGNKIVEESQDDVETMEQHV